MKAVLQKQMTVSYVFIIVKYLLEIRQAFHTPNLAKAYKLGYKQASNYNS